MTFSADDLPEEGRIVEAMLADVGKGVAPVAALESTKRPPGRPFGSKNVPKPLADTVPAGPKPASIDVPDTQLPRRRGRALGSRNRKPEANVTSEQLADMIIMGHTLAASMISPAAGISEKDAKKIGDAMIPVMEDFGIVVVGKVVHILALLAVIVVVEAPIVIGVVTSAQQQALARRSGQNLVTNTVREEPMSSTTPGPASSVSFVSQQLGVETGAPNS